MQKLENYLQDGANEQARAVMCLLQPFNIEESWDSNIGYKALINVSRWYNSREQGYVFSLTSLDHDIDQLNIAVYQNRISDCLDAVSFVENTYLTPPTYTSKAYDAKYIKPQYADYRVDYGEILKMVRWIKDQFNDWWLFNCKCEEVLIGNNNEK